jgi:hypothetical protein
VPPVTCIFSRGPYAPTTMNLYGTSMSGPELTTVLHVQDNLRKAERLHRVSGDLKERRRLRLLLPRRRETPAPVYEPCPVPDRAA